MELKGSKTEKNLYRTFLGESRARNKYTLYAEKAKKEGYQWIAEVFDITAINELAHARRIYRDFLRLVCSTKENLVDAICGETAEYKDLYAKFEKEAREEGFDDIAKLFDLVAKIEAHHEERYKKLIDNINNSTVFKSEGKKLWICRNCGHIHYGESAPKVCPTCKHPQAYFEIMAENF